MRVGATLREKCPNTEFFWSVFSCIQSEYSKIRTGKEYVFGRFSRSTNQGDVLCKWKKSLKNSKILLVLFIFTLFH